MAEPFQTTCWQGMVIEHPRAWELAVASGAGEARRCSFADRFYHRLDVTWQQIDFVPQVALLLDKHRKTAQKQKVACHEVADLPAGWAAIRQDTTGGQVVRAARFFPEARTLAEAAVVWPEARDRQLEADVLAGIHPADDGPVTLWQAMGLTVRIAREFELYESKAPVGKVEWHFRDGVGPEGIELAVARLAMPKYWLEGPLRDWLAEQAPVGARVVRQETAQVNAHRAERMLYAEPAGLAAKVRGTKRYRLETAWLCPVEERVYRVTCVQRRREEELPLPESFSVSCCRPAGAGQGGRT